MILYFSVFTIKAFFHVDDGLDVAGSHLHDQCHANISVDFLQLINDSSFSKVLHANVNGCDNVCPINGRRVHDVKKLVEHLATMHDAILPTENGIVGQLKSKPRRVFSSIHGTHGSTSQRTIGALSRIEFFVVETTGIFRKTEQG